MGTVNRFGLPDIGHSRRHVALVGLVALGDIVMLALFVAAGLLAHAIHPLAFPVHAVMTAVPFIIGWALVAPVGGMYAKATLGSFKRTVGRVIVVWTVASLVGAGIRATPFFHGGAPVEFLLVNIVFGTAFLLPWRLVVVLVNRRLGASP